MSLSVWHKAERERERERWRREMKFSGVGEESEDSEGLFSSPNMSVFRTAFFCRERTRKEGRRKRTGGTGGSSSHVGRARCSAAEERGGANERRDDRKMISPQISHHLKRTIPGGGQAWQCRTEVGKGGRSDGRTEGAEVGQRWSRQ